MGDFLTDLNKQDQVQLPRYIAALENVRHVPDEYVLLGILKICEKKYGKDLIKSWEVRLGRGWRQNTYVNRK